MLLYDAHTHSPTAGCALAVLNSAQPSEWPRVTALAASALPLPPLPPFPRLIPSYGLHPWYCANAPADWLAQLRARLLANPRAQVGEIGLDRNIPKRLPPTPIEPQLAVFTAQLALAAELDRVASIHCTRAHGLLLDTLRQVQPRPRFLLHAYSGSAELVREFAKLGGYFSFGAPPAPQRARTWGGRGGRAAVRAVPPERLLVETDTPAEAEADAVSAPQLETSLTPRTPLPDLARSYRALADVVGEPLVAFTERVALNFRQLFPQ